MARHSADENDVSPRDFSARAAWLSFVGGLTQDQIAKELGISRQRVQRLIARASAEGLIRVRINHPIARCLELERSLKSRFDLEGAWVSPSTGSSTSQLEGLATFAAPVLERFFLSEDNRTYAVGTGRTISAVVEQMQPVNGARHKLAALNGNIFQDGSATAYEVIVLLAKKTSAPQYPLGIPVIARTPQERDLYLSLPHVRATRALAESAETAVVGLGQIGEDAPLYVDGYISAEELADLQAAGAAGEIAGYVFDANGQYLDHPVNTRNMGVCVPVNGMQVCCIVAGLAKLNALRAALKGGLISHLVTDEATAKALNS